MKASPVSEWVSGKVRMNAVCAVSHLPTFSLSPLRPGLHHGIQFDLT